MCDIHRVTPAVVVVRHAFRFSSMFVVAALMSAVNAMPTPGRATSHAAADVRLLVRVAASEPWTDTGIELLAGDHVEISSWGVVTVQRLRSPRRVGPNGAAVVPAGCRFVLARPSGAPYGLIGNVAAAATLDGRGFAVGARWADTAPIVEASRPSGRLFLGINHDAVECDRSGYDSWTVRNDTSGAFTAEVFVWRKR